MDKEQLEDEGWTFEPSTENYWKEGYSLCHWSPEFQENNIRIEGLNGEVLFQGECKSINEFRYICRLLGI